MPRPAAPSLTRRPQAERSADTRAKLVRATISCLHRVGYGSTTVTMVADEAGVSRGAMTHQFPAKTDLMLAVVRAVFDEDVVHYEEARKALSPLEYMRRSPAITWEAVNRPAAIAVTEIMLASRSDPELAERLRTMQAEIDEVAFAWTARRRRAAGLSDERTDNAAIHRLFVAAARGLALEAMVMRNDAEVEKAIEMLGHITKLLYPAKNGETPGESVD